jgi:hypothetical protein
LNAVETPDAFVGIRMLGGGTDISNGSSYPGCACSLQKAATVMPNIHRRLLSQRHSTSETRTRRENGCEEGERAVYGNTGKELQVKFFEDFCYVIENDGRPVGTRTPDLYRVKAA